jgi:hypothetical protein
VHAAAAVASAPAAAGSSASLKAAFPPHVDALQQLRDYSIATDSDTRMALVRRFGQMMRREMNAEIVNHWTPPEPNALPLLDGKHSVAAELEDRLIGLSSVSGAERAKQLQTIFDLMGALFKASHAQCLREEENRGAAATTPDASAVAQPVASSSTNEHIVSKCEGAWLLFLAENIRDHPAPLAFYLQNNVDALASLHWNASLVQFGQAIAIPQQSPQPKEQCSILSTLLSRFHDIEQQHALRLDWAEHPRVVRVLFRDAPSASTSASASAAASGSASVSANDDDDEYDDDDGGASPQLVSGFVEPPLNLWDPLLVVLEASARRAGYPKLALSGVRNERGEGLLTQLARFVPFPDNEQHWAYRLSELFLHAGCRADGRPSDNEPPANVAAAATAAAAAPAAAVAAVAAVAAGEAVVVVGHRHRDHFQTPLETWLSRSEPLPHACILVLLLHHGAPAEVDDEPLLVFLAHTGQQRPKLLTALLDAAEQHASFLGLDPLARAPFGLHNTFAHALFARCLRYRWYGPKPAELFDALTHEVHARPALWFELQLPKYNNYHGQTLSMLLREKMSEDSPLLEQLEHCLQRAKDQWLYERDAIRRAVESELSTCLNHMHGNSTNVLQADNETDLVMHYLCREDALEPKKPKKA